MSYFAAAAASNFRRRPLASAAALAIAASLIAKHLDTSGAVQSPNVSAGGQTITVDAPAYMLFDMSETRTDVAGGTDKIGALLNIGYLTDFGTAEAGNWAWGGPDGPRPRRYERGQPRAARVYSEPGTYTHRARIRNSEGDELTITNTIIVRDPAVSMTTQTILVSAGAWPVLQSNRCYLLEPGGDYTGFGALDTTGLVNVVFTVSGAGANAQIGQWTIDRRTEGEMGSAITRTRGVRLDRINTTAIRYGLPGFDWCSISRAPSQITSYGPLFSQGQAFNDAVTFSRGETVANNIRYPIGWCAYDAGEFRSYGSFVLFSTSGTEEAWIGCDLHKNDGDGGGQVFRGRWYRAIFRHNRLRNTGSSTGYGRFEGGECRAANGDLPDEWRSDARAGDYVGGFLYGYPAQDNIAEENQYGASGATTPAAGIGTGPENNLVGQPKQSQRYCVFENNSVFGTVMGTSLNGASFGGGLHIGARVLKYLGNGADVSIDTSNPNTNRLPPGENGPYINTQTNTRPVPTAF